MITEILIGILSSTVAELVTALNKKLQNTVLKGDGAFLVALALSLVGAIAKIAMTSGFSVSMFTNYQALATTFSEVFAVSQVFFIFVVKKLNLDVQETKQIS